MRCKPHDLVLIPFPYADLGSSKKRPVLVLTNPDRHGDFIALAVTTVAQPEPAIQLTSADIGDGELFLGWKIRFLPPVRNDKNWVRHEF